MKNSKKILAIVLWGVLLAISLGSCGGGGSSTGSNPPVQGNSLTPIWAFDEIPDLKFAKISRNGNWAIVAADYHIVFLDLVNKTKLHEISTNESENDYVDGVSISDQGFAVVNTANSIKVFSATDGVIADFGGKTSINNKWYNIGGSPVVISPSGASYYAYGYLKFNVPNTPVWANDPYLYDNNGNYIGPNPNYESSNYLAVSGDGEYIASASSVYNSPVLLNGNGEILWKSTYNNDAAEGIAISYNGNVIALGTLSEITIYTKDNPTPVIKWPHNSYGAVVAVSDDGMVVAGGVAGKLIIFENLSSQPLVYDKPDGTVIDIAISSDGNTIVLATDFGGLEIYDKNGNLKYQHDTEYEGAVGSVSISSDGKTVGCVFGGKFNLYKIQ